MKSHILSTLEKWCVRNRVSSVGYSIPIVLVWRRLQGCVHVICFVLFCFPVLFCIVLMYIFVCFVLFLVFILFVYSFMVSKLHKRISCFKLFKLDIIDWMKKKNTHTHTHTLLAHFCRLAQKAILCSDFFFFLIVCKSHLFFYFKECNYFGFRLITGWNVRFQTYFQDSITPNVSLLIQGVSPFSIWLTKLNRFELNNWQIVKQLYEAEFYPT